MIKKFTFKLNKEYSDKLLIAIRNKSHIIEVLMNSIKYIYLYNDPDIDLEIEDTENELILYINKESKISRLFFLEEKRIYSIGFPFFLSLDDNNNIKKIYSNIIDDITLKLTSDVISLIGCKKENRSQCSYEFFEPIMEYQDENEYIWDFLKELLTYEDAYLRYDFDPNTFEEYRKKGIADHHPTNHYDIFYTTGSTFKLGLKSTINFDDFLSLLKVNSKCSFLN
ncbi:hypothetical protein [Aliarcobacter butzleri]|uniref:hypothetical protein n=1 Tax=Aliarcobacter butzleri TaxID=28197 RepID=UPI003B210763